MNLLSKLFRKSKLQRPFRRGLRLESLENRSLLAADTLPVLLVIADDHDFYYKEYNDTRQSLEAAGLDVQVAATTTNPSTPHWNSGQGWEIDGVVVPDVALANVNPDEYSAIAFVGGWGSSMYQYAFEGTYANVHYQGDLATKQVVNDLVNEFLADDKPVGAICHGVTVLAWARVDGASPLDGKQVSVPFIGSPAVFYNEVWYGDMELGQYEQAVSNGAVANTVSGQYGDPTTAADDVIVDGRIITAENWDSAAYFGEVLAEQVLASENENPPPANQAPVAMDSLWQLDEHSPVGTVVGTVLAADPDVGQSLTYTFGDGNIGNAFAIDPVTGQITVANPAAVNFETTPVFQLTVNVTDDGNASLSDSAIITIELRDIVEPLPVGVHAIGDDLVVQGTSQSDTIYLWSGRTDQEVFVWMNGVLYGSRQLQPGGRVRVFSGAGNDVVCATDTRRSVELFGEAGHDLLVGSRADDLIVGGDGVDRLRGGMGNDVIMGGNGNDVIGGDEGNDILLGGDGDDWMEGHDGRDLLFGGLGSDTLRGGGNEDLLVGGRTSFDDDAQALKSIRDAWLAPGTVAERKGKVPLQLSVGIQYSFGQTVFDDLARDTLWGAADADLLYAHSSDAVFASAEDVLA